MASKYPQISIITPSYNQGHLIKETIDSVLSQNYPNLDFWVIDGQSTDDTLTVLKSYGSKINWLSESDHGQTEAINKGLKKAKGEIITYLNSDDVFLPNTLHTVAEFFTDHPESDWLTGDYFIIDEVGNKIQPFVSNYKRLLRNWPTQKLLAVTNYVIQPSTFWTRRLQEKVGLFDEELSYVMDYDYWMRCFQAGYKLAVVPHHFSLFRIHDQSKGGVLYQQQFVEEHQIMKRYVTNPILRGLHWLHAQLIIQIYKRIK